MTQNRLFIFNQVEFQSPKPAQFLSAGDLSCWFPRKAWEPQEEKMSANNELALGAIYLCKDHAKNS